MTICFYCLQTTLCKSIAIADISPNIMLVIPICFGFFKGSKEGIFAGVVGGILMDAFYTSIFGFSVLFLAWIGYMAGTFTKEYNQERMIIPLLITLVSTFSYDFLIYVGGFLLYNRLNMLYYLGRIIIPGTMYTCAVMILLYRPMHSLDRLFDPRDRKKVTDYVSRN